MRCINRSTTSPASRLLAAAVCAVLLAPLPALASECLPVSGDRIRLGDLAAALPPEAIDDPARAVGFAPRPGVRRTLLFREWAAGRMRLPHEPAELCVTGEAHRLAPEAVREALAQSFATLTTQPGIVIPDIVIEELPLGAVPSGTLQFPAANLRAARPNPRTGIVQVNGYILYGSDPARPLHFPIWVRARIEADLARVELTCNLNSGDEATAGCLRMATTRGYPFSGAPGAPDPSRFLGRAARRRLAAGSVAEDAMFTPRQDVKPRQEVSLLVRCGTASLRLKAVSQTGGAIGETVTIRVEGARHPLRAQVTAPGAVEVLVPAATTASTTAPGAAPVSSPAAATGAAPQEGPHDTKLD